MLWCTGDMVNRGPDSLSTLRYLKSLGDHCITVLGNHDFHLMSIICGFREPRWKDTLDDVLAAPDVDELMEWLRHRPMLHHDADRQITMTHAGIPPVWTIKQAQKEARRLEKALQSDDYVYWLKKIFKPSKSRPWDDGYKAKRKIRMTAAYLTQMRFCNEAGVLDLKSKGATVSKDTSASKGFAPWFDFPQSPSYQEQIIFGHWAALEGVTRRKNIHAIDTGCAWGKQLTALNVDTFERISVDG